MFDFAVVGSGVSGGRMVDELTAAGASCVLIEAGREHDRAKLPLSELEGSTALFWGGGVEMTTDGRMGLLRARCLGGTSIVNQALVDRFDSIALDDWQDRSGVTFLNTEDLEPDYGAVEATVAIEEIPERHRGANARAFIRGMEHIGYEWAPLKRAQADCALEHGSDCIACLYGCPRDSKQSALVTGIRRARARGLQVETGVEVHSVERKGGYWVVRGHQGRERRSAEFRSGTVVLAAGALGNVGVLARSGFGRKLPALGRGFSCHPQFMSYGLFKERIDAHKGAFSSVKSADASLRRAGFKFENVFAPPITTAMLMPGLGREHLRRMRAYRHYATIETCVRDEPNGVVRPTRAGGVAVSKALTSADYDKLARARVLIGEALEAAGAREVIHCDDAFGLHLMGGCAIGVDARASVVGPDFAVHGFPGLYAADSSIFPSAPGINPSFTIMALSLRAARGILKKP